MNPVQIAAKMYECRDAARTLLGEHYLQRMQDYGSVVRNVAEKRQVGILEAGRIIADSVKENGMMAILVLAATVELIEPSA